jgi:hypothetical protein
MTKEGKTIVLALLTVFVFALMTFIDHEQVIFPFPLNEVIFLIVLVYFIKLHSGSHKLYLSLVGITGFFQLLSSEFYWSIFLTSEQMLVFSESIATDVFQLVALVGMLSWILLSFMQFDKWFYRLIALLPVSLVLVGALFGNPMISFMGYIVVLVLAIKQLRHFSLAYLWILWIVLEGTKLWSLA